MPFAILLNGSVNSGKTTVSKALCHLRDRMAHVEVDALHDFIEWMPLAESIPLNLKNAASVGRNFLDHGLDIVISYPLGLEDYQYLVDQLHPYPVHAVTLRPPLDVARTNRGDRELTDWEIQRIPEQYGYGLPEFETIMIDNSSMTPSETAKSILEFVLNSD